MTLFLNFKEVDMTFIIIQLLSLHNIQKYTLVKKLMLKK